MRFEIITIFPGFFSGFLENGILRRAIAGGLVEVAVHDLRAFTHDRHRTVDDRPFGGGEGMVLKPQPIAEALESLGIEPRHDSRRGLGDPSGAEAQIGEAELGARLKSCPDTELLQTRTKPLQSLEGSGTSEAGSDTDSDPEEMKGQASGFRPAVILLSAQGRPFTQSLARELALLDRVVLICGRYEGVDERINQLYCDMELSIGDYVLSGGELAAAVVIDASMRMIPGVLGNEASGEFESFGIADAQITTDAAGVPRSQHGAGGLLDYPHYTRPAEFQGMPVPETLLNGDHQAIRSWRREQQLRKTLANRPDLLQTAVLSGDDHKLLETIQTESPDTANRG
jgi:tRNA (guanine37-N1)-methyltransferase